MIVQQNVNISVFLFWKDFIDKHLTKQKISENFQVLRIACMS